MPDGIITREEFLKLLVRLFDIEQAYGDVSFEDVQSGAWYEQDIKTAVAAGIVRGCLLDTSRCV